MKRTAVERFSLRGAWDTLVILLLLIAIGCLSYYVQKHATGLLTWPRVERVRVEGNLRPADYEVFKSIVVAPVSKGLLRISTSRLEMELEKLPWVYRRTVEEIMARYTGSHSTGARPNSSMG